VASSTIFPFPATRGVSTTPRPPSPTASNRNDFGGAMDRALDPRGTRRADGGPRADARRPEPARARAADDKGPMAQARRVNTSKPASRADRPERPSDDARVERTADNSSTGAPVVADQAETPAEARTDAGTVALPGEQVSGDGAPDAVAEVPLICDPGSLIGDGDGDGDGDADAIDGDDPLARGRRWAPPGGDAANAQEQPNPNAAANRGKGTPGLGLKVGHAIQQAGTDANAAPGEALAQIAKDVVAAARAAAGAADTAADHPVTEAIESAAATSQAPATSTVETAASASVAVAAVEASADTDAGDAPPQDHGQAKPQASSAQSNPNTAVAAGGVENGARFTVNSAAGNAAYTSAAPRAEETVLPQIVQSIRLQAVQGTTEARVQLKPEHLGNLNITLKVEHNQVTATIQADVAAVRQWIESHEASLRQSLSEQGLQLVRLEVHPDGQQAARDEQGSDQPRRQPRRRSWRGDDATFEVLV
jgi:flagellar hook-length control protein FliK